MTPVKIDLINGAYQQLRISGLTTQPTNEDVSYALSTMDDWAAQLSTTLDTGYLQPAEYGTSDPNDSSGVDIKLAGPFKKLLALELAAAFGKDIPPALALSARNAQRDLEHLLVSVDIAQNPPTLPLGSGNQYTLTQRTFYPEPNNDDGAINKYENEVFLVSVEWESFLGVNVLDSVDYDHDAGIILSQKSTDGTTSTVTVAFSQRGQFELCVTATDSAGLKETKRYFYNSLPCRKNSATNGFA